MSALDKKITIKLMIDGKEAIATLDLADLKAEKLYDQLTKQANAPLLKQFKQDLLGISEVSEDAVNGIMEFVQMNNLSEQEIQQVIQSLMEERQALGMLGVDHKKSTVAIENLTEAYKRMSIANAQNVAGANKMRVASGAARQTVGQFGFALGDAGMIAVDFRMFLLSIGNNIPFVVQGLANVKNEAAAAGKSMGQYLKSNIDTGMKLVLGANAIMFALQVLPALFNKINESSRKAAEEGMKKFNKELQEMTELDVEEKLEEIKNIIEKIKPPDIERMGNFITSGLFENLFGDTNEYEMYQKQRDALKEKDEEIDEEKTRRVGKLKLEIEKYENLIKRVSDTDENAAQKILDLTDKKAAKQKELDQLLMTSEERQKKNRDEADKQFKQLDNELKAAQDHAVSMIEIETDSQEAILTLKKKNIEERIKLYEKYGQDVTELQYELKEIEARIEKEKADEIEKDQEERAKKALENRKRRAKETEDWERENIKWLNSYYDTVQFSDERYYSYRQMLINNDLDRLRESGLSEIELNAYKTERMKNLDDEYFNWKWEQYTKDNQLSMESLDVMWRGYDTFFNSLTQQGLGWTERMQRVWEALESAFLSMLSNMLKDYIESLIQRAVIATTQQAASVAAATATGTSIATAYAPAAALASIATFGGADIAAAAGLTSTVALAQALALGGFEKGGRLPKGKFGFVEGYHDEIIAPEEDFKTVHKQIMFETMGVLRGEALSGSYSNNNSPEVINEIKLLNENLEKHANRPLLFKFTKGIARLIYQEGKAAFRKTQ